MLRLEDLDVARAKRQYSEDVIRDLEWLGLDWDGEIITQSDGTASILSLADRLVREGKAYPCICQRAEILAAQGAPHEAATEPRYPGTCRGQFSSVEEAERTSGRPAGLRFVVPPGEVAFRDGIAGPQTFDVQGSVGDFPITRKDNAPAYQLAVVADDSSEGVTHVLRGEDLLSSTARQILLYEALGRTAPLWFHLPLVCDASGRRLAKRTDDLSLRELRDRGVDPRALISWVAKTCGMEVPPVVTAREAVGLFDVERVPKTRVTVDAETFVTLMTNG